MMAAISDDDHIGYDDRISDDGLIGDGDRISDPPPGIGQR